jgi:hypothetical protein
MVKGFHALTQEVRILGWQGRYRGIAGLTEGGDVCGPCIDVMMVVAHRAHEPIPQDCAENNPLRGVGFYIERFRDCALHKKCDRRSRSR